MRFFGQCISLLFCHEIAFQERATRSGRGQHILWLAIGEYEHL